MSGTSTLDLGGADGGGNSCFGNTDGAVANDTASAVAVPARGNWWGTADGPSIGAMMFGAVDYSNWLTSP